MSSERYIQAKMRLETLNELRARKRRARDIMFNALGYRRLQFRFAVHSALKLAKADKVVLAKPMLLGKGINNEILFSHWRL